MAFPSVAARVVTIFATQSTTHNVPMDASIAAGDLLTVLFCSFGSGTHTTPSGWSVVRSGNNGTNCRVTLFAKVADGTEDGTNVNFATSTSIEAAAVRTRITTGTWEGTLAGIEAAASFATGTSTTPNPPLFNPSWGAEDTLWFCGGGQSDNNTISAAPTNYGNLTWDDVNGTNDLNVFQAERQLNTGSDEDPGTFTASASDPWATITWAVRPASAGSPATVTPDAIAVAVTVPTPTVTGAAAVAPAAVAVAATLPTPSILAASVVTPLNIDAIIALPTPTVGVITIVEPAAIDVPITLPTPQPSVPGSVSPDAIAVPLEVPTPTVAVSAGSTPGPIDVTLEVPTPSILAAALVTPAAIAVPVTLPTPTPSVEATVAPAAIAIATTLPTPSIIQAANVSPAVVLVNVAVPNPNVFAGALEILARALGQFHRLSDRLHIASIGQSRRSGFRITDEGWERVSDIFVYDLDPAGRGDIDTVNEAVAAAWAANAGADEATLRQAIHEALDAFGFRRPDGTRLI